MAVPRSPAATRDLVPAPVAVPPERRSFPATAEAVRAARRFVVEAVAPPADYRAGLLALLVSEIATNAVLHARTPFEVSVSRDGDVVRVAVSDGSLLVPVAKPYPAHAPAGRGLSIVEATATAWGVEPREGGKAVWFTYDLAAPDPARSRATTNPTA